MWVFHVINNPLKPQKEKTMTLFKISFCKNFQILLENECELMPRYGKLAYVNGYMFSWLIFRIKIGKAL